MLRLNDFVTARKRFYNLSRGLFISASKHCRKMKFRTHIHLTLVSKMLCFSDFMTCRERFNVQSNVQCEQFYT